MTPGENSFFDSRTFLMLATATPAALAQTVSRGRWKIAPHLKELNRALVELAAGRQRRLIVQMPPRHGKSELASRYFPAWYLGTFPDRRVILTSATGELAAEFSASARDALLEHGSRLFGCRLAFGWRRRDLWRLESGGSLRSAGVGGDIMGRGADLLIVDDYFKNSEEALSPARREAVLKWFLSTSSTRLSPEGAIVIIATRWHRDDLIGRLLAESSRGGESYRVLRFPALAEKDDPLGRRVGAALWPDRFDRRWLQARQAAYAASGYRWMWQALYQQQPPEMLDSEFDPAYFGPHIWFGQPPEPARVVLRVMALDPSLGHTDRSDYSAIVALTLDAAGVMWIDADLERRDKTRLAAAAVEWGRRFEPDGFAVEANQFQTLLADDIARRSRELGVALPIYELHNSLPKRSRIRCLTPYLARGDFRFQRDSPGARLLVDQLREFPGGRYDDGPDALEMALRLARKLLAEEPPTGPGIVIPA